MKIQLQIYAHKDTLYAHSAGSKQPQVLSPSN